MIFDTHAHYDDHKFDADREELIAQLAPAGIGAVCNIASDLPSIDTTLEIARKHEHFYCALGIHPSECVPLTEEKLEEIRQKLHDPKAVAVGEIGLDYYWPEPGRELQKKWFVRQLEMASEEHLPVVIHSRDAAQDTLEIMKESCGWDNGGVIHCFSYSVEVAREYTKRGFYIGVGGVVTFKNGRKLKEVVADTPLSQIVLETDSPYLAPVPNRGKRNSSLNLPYVVAEIARIKGVSTEEVEAVTWENGHKLYHLAGENI